MTPKKYRIEAWAFASIGAINAVIASTVSHIPALNWAMAALLGGLALFYFRVAKRLEMLRGKTDVPFNCNSRDRS